MNDLADKVAIVTGATSGIGQAIAVKLVNEGAKVFFIGRSFENLKEKNVKIEEGANIIFIKADFTRQSDLDELIKKIGTQKVDILIHSAGSISFDLFEKELIENFDFQYSVNMRAPFLITQRLLPNIKLAKGIILFINSTVGLEAQRFLSQYSATKHALRALSKSLHKELRNEGIKISNLYLGATDTPMQRNVQINKGNEYNNKKFINPDEIAEFVLFLIEKSKNMTISDVTILPSYYE